MNKTSTVAVERQSVAATSSQLLGAAFLMATSAVGPGFLNNTAVFTKSLLASFGFVILLSVILDIFAQINIWRIVVVSESRAQDIANRTIKGSGYFLAAIIAFGGLAFNIGNIAGASLGLNVLFGLDLRLGAVISASVAILVFAFKEAGKALDMFTKVLGFLMIALISYVCWKSNPPLQEIAFRTIIPVEIDPVATVALVGGTVGGYITFAGAHRLLDAGIKGAEHLKSSDRAAATGIILTSIIRYLLFVAAFGVIVAGAVIDEKNPAASVFRGAAGEIGYKIFGIVIFAAAITSVVGAAYTSVSFVKTFHSKIASNERWVIVGFIVVSTLIFIPVGQPVFVLVWAGVLNGFVLPIALGLILVSSRLSRIVGDYKHPIWMQICGWIVVVAMAGLSIYTLVREIGRYFR